MPIRASSAASACERRREPRRSLPGCTAAPDSPSRWTARRGSNRARSSPTKTFSPATASKYSCRPRNVTDSFALAEAPLIRQVAEEAGDAPTPLDALEKVHRLPMQMRLTPAGQWYRTGELLARQGRVAGDIDLPEVGQVQQGAQGAVEA